MKTQSLNGTWQLRHETLSTTGLPGLQLVKGKGEGWLNATVPGEVHLHLIAAGLMQEPLFSDNCSECRWPQDRSWWYRTCFVVDRDLLNEQVKELVFDCLDYYGQVYLNGVLIGESENAFVPAVFDVSHQLREGGNELVIRLTAGTERAKNQQIGQSTAGNIYANRQSFKGTPELRKPQFEYGWDWVDALPNIGIWRDVQLHGYSHVRLFDVKHWCELSEDHVRCLIHMEIDVENLHPSAETAGIIEISLIDDEQHIVSKQSHALLLPVGINRLRTTLPVDNPKLWWPNGMGEQPLYQLTVTADTNGQTRNTWSRPIGLRTIHIDRSPLPVGHRFALQVNGQNVFCKGGNWVPADAIPARISRDKYERLIADAAEAHMTMLRVWGGGIYESDHFYNACDRLGILVWQDFMFACNPYPDQNEAFQDKVRRETEAAIRRLRHHACIALWCANNENTLGFASWWGNKQYEFPDANLVTGGQQIYSRVLPQVCMALDPGRPYWPGSPSGGDSPDSEIEGDVHWWHEATMHPDITRRYRHEVYDECKGRFVSEYGIVGPCQLTSIRQYLKPDQIDPNCHAWQLHTNSFEKGTTAAAIRHHYAEPEHLSIEQYIRFGQMFQALMYGRTIESMRFRKTDPADDCAGALIWMFNDCWGEIGWTPIDYFLRRKASYYWIRNACYPLRAIVRRRGHELVTRIVNDTLTERSLTVRFGWMAVDGSANELQSKIVVAPANGMLEIVRDTIPSPDNRPHDAWIYVTYLEADGTEPIPCIWTLLPYRQLRTVEPCITWSVEGSKITLTAKAYAHGVCHPDDGQRLFSDNYFDLVPGLPKVIECRGPMPKNLHFQGIAAR